MPYDIFISYSRLDNQEGRITQFVDRIKADFAQFASRELVPFEHNGNYVPSIESNLGYDT